MMLRYFPMHIFIKLIISTLYHLNTFFSLQKKIIPLMFSRWPHWNTIIIRVPSVEHNNSNSYVANGWNKKKWKTKSYNCNEKSVELPEGITIWMAPALKRLAVFYLMICEKLQFWKGRLLTRRVLKYCILLLKRQATS